MGIDDNTTTATASVADDLVANLQSYQQYFHWISHTYNHPTTLTGLVRALRLVPAAAMLTILHQPTTSTWRS